MACEFNTGDKRGELSAGTPCSMAMRTVISRTMTKCENGARRSKMLADVKTSFLYGDARRSLHVELALEEPLTASGRHACWNSRRSNELAGPSLEDKLT